MFVIHWIIYCDGQISEMLTEFTKISALIGLKIVIIIYWNGDKQHLQLGLNLVSDFVTFDWFLALCW